MTQAARALDRPDPPGPVRRPCHQALGLARRGTYPQLAQRLLRRPDRHRSVRPLVRVYPDHHCIHNRPLLARAGVTVAGMPDFGQLASRLFRATPRQDPVSWHVVNKPGRTRRRAVREPAHRASERYGKTAAPTGSLNQAARRAFSPAPASLDVMPPIEVARFGLSTRCGARALEVAEHQISKRDRPGLGAPIQVVRRVRSAGSNSTAKGRVIRPGVPATSVVRVTYRPRLREHATTFGVPCSSTRQ